MLRVTFALAALAACLPAQLYLDPVALPATPLGGGCGPTGGLEFAGASHWLHVHSDWPPHYDFAYPLMVGGRPEPVTFSSCSCTMMVPDPIVFLFPGAHQTGFGYPAAVAGFEVTVQMMQIGYLHGSTFIPMPSACTEVAGGVWFSDAYQVVLR